jgi:hypothetical protein
VSHIRLPSNAPYEFLALKLLKSQSPKSVKLYPRHFISCIFEIAAAFTKMREAERRQSENLNCFYSPYLSICVLLLRIPLS